MTDPQTLAAIIDGCIEDVLLGNATVEECLEREPAHRAELEPLLRAAVAISAIPVPELQPNPVRRAAFMAELRSTPQDRPRFRMPGLPALGLGSSLLRFATVAAPAAAIAIVALALVWGGSPSTASAATLTVFAGSVEQQVEGDWRPVADGSTLDEGTTIRTAAAALAMLTFPDGSTATVDASTVVALENISVDGDRMISLRQITGRTWNDVVPIEQGDSYVIHTPHAVVAAHGTVFETVVNGDTAVLTAEGLVSLAQDGASVEVSVGQIVRATTQSISAPESAPNLGEIRVSGPVSAYLSSSEGAATGVLMNGLVFRQIPGITTTTEELDGENLQRIALGDPEQGEYSLVLRRFAPGEGTVTVQTTTGTIEVPIPENVAIARLPLEVSNSAEGALVLNTLSTELESVGEVPPVRVVETERTRQAEMVEATARATEMPATAGTQADSAPSGGGQGQQGAPNAATDTPGQATRTAAPQAPRDSWAGRLQDALARGDDRRLEAVLDETLDTDDDATKATRLALLAAVMSDPTAAARIRAQADRGLVEEISTEAAQLTPGLADGLRSGFAPPSPARNDREPDPSSGGDRPGNSGNAPGNSGNKPGNSGSAPGNSGNGPSSSQDNARGNADDQNDADRGDRANDDDRPPEAPRQPEAAPDNRGTGRTPDWLQQLLETLRGSLNGSSADRNSAAATSTPTSAPTPTPTSPPTAAPRATATPIATSVARATGTLSPTPPATATPASRPSPTATPTPTRRATETATPANSPTPTAMVNPSTTATPPPLASPTAMPAPTEPPPDVTPAPEEPWWWPPWWGPYPW